MESRAAHVVSVSVEDQDLIAALEGEMDNRCVDEVLALANHPRNTARKIILDLADVSYIDSSGIYAIVRLQGRSLGLGLRNATPPVTTVLKVCGLDVLLKNGCDEA